MLKSKASQVAFAAMALKQASPVKTVAKRLPPAMLFPGYACQPDGSTKKGNLSQNHSLVNWIYHTIYYFYILQTIGFSDLLEEIHLNSFSRIKSVQLSLIYLPDGPAKLMTVNPVSGAGNGVGPGAVVGKVVAENIDIYKCVFICIPLHI